MEEYTYTINTDTQNINIAHLSSLIYQNINKKVYREKDSDILEGNISFINENIPDNLVICFDEVLSGGEESTLSNLISSYSYDESYKADNKVLILSPNIITNDVDNYSPEGINECIFLRLYSSKKIEITGISAPNYYQTIRICNIGNNKIDFKNNDSDSLPQNRFLMSSNKISVGSDSSIVISYDLISQRWRINNLSTLL